MRNGGDGRVKDRESTEERGQITKDEEAAGQGRKERREE